jgi:hypothetical protein
VETVIVLLSEHCSFPVGALTSPADRIRMLVFLDLIILTRSFIQSFARLNPKVGSHHRTSLTHCLDAKLAICIDY